MMHDVTEIRRAIVDAIPMTTSSHGEAPDERALYVPPAHIKALRLECNLVVGARGVGKSFWTAALSSRDLRASLGKSVKELERTDVYVGFGVAPNIDAYPDGDVFNSLMQAGHSPYEIWRAVVVRWVAVIAIQDVPKDSWGATVGWVAQNPEPVAKLLQAANSTLSAAHRFGLIVFDALDRTSREWDRMDDIVRDLLRVVLWLKSYPRLHAKVFLREDQSDRTVTNFADASKLLATKAELTWAPHDLHGLLWQMLCNAPSTYGELCRDIYRSVVGREPPEVGGVWQIAEEVKREGVKQRDLFEVLAGEWMGRDRRRGVPYVWSVSHLADGRGRASPRSFLAAIGQAAEDSQLKYPDHSYALHYESIKRGVQRASEIRVSEMAEDYPWVTQVMGPLKGISVPCAADILERAWMDTFPGGVEAAAVSSLPPQHAERGWAGVRSDLERLGVLETMRDGRVNLPDLYRVGFGMGRRGGVKPIN
jgi:hypothetical protein